jgi:hypothetical protein
VAILPFLGKSLMHKLLVAIGFMADVVSGLTTLLVASQLLWDRAEKLIHTAFIGL